MQFDINEIGVVVGSIGVVMGGLTLWIKADLRAAISDALLDIAGKKYLTEADHLIVCAGSHRQLDFMLKNITDAIKEIDTKLLRYQAELSITTQRVKKTVGAVHEIQKKNGLPVFDPDSPFL